MSVVIVGGNECMERQYKDIWKAHGYRAKVFAKMPADFKKKIGTPNLIVLFTNTVSHKMVECAAREGKRCNAVVARTHSSSACALREVLQAHCAGLAQ